MNVWLLWGGGGDSGRPPTAGGQKEIKKGERICREKLERGERK